MTHYRAEYRAAVREALETSDAFARWLCVPSWGQAICEDNLPAWGVSTPSEPVSRVTKDTVQRSTQLVLLLMLRGGDELEDAADEACSAAEALVLPALQAIAWDAALAQTNHRVASQDGSQRIASVELTFTVWRNTPEGLPLVDED